MDSSKINSFINFCRDLKGDEKGEAQTFCNHFFQLFGHQDVISASGSFESRIKFSNDSTKFADCIWEPIGHSGVLIEMKKRKEKNLEKHFPQVRDYWIEMNPEVVIGPSAQKPRFIILCNFDTFIIYKDLCKVDEVCTNELVDRIASFNFMYLEEKAPVFKINTTEISEGVAKTIGELFKYQIYERHNDHEKVQRFLLQCILAMFSEDFGLLPNALFTQIVRECIGGKNNSYDALNALFTQMASSKQAIGGRYKDVPYFNGGLFKTVDPIELDGYSLILLESACSCNWKHVNPAIFGSLFEGTMNSKERHQYGAHFTREVDIFKIINPTIIRPWRERINKARTQSEYYKLLEDLSRFKVLDPACGCGNFLFVSYLALREIEFEIIEKIIEKFKRIDSYKFSSSYISTQQFFGIDIQPVAVEVAKVTMMLAKEIASEMWNSRRSITHLDFNASLPLENMEDNIICKDALLEPWPDFDVVIGNPPYQSKNKMKQEMDNTYIDKVRAAFPTVSGRVDFCVYWFRKAHELMKDGQRAGLVGTNSIRQNDSRIGGLDYIVQNNGTITDSVSTEVWSGDAVVYVSIVNWIKGTYSGERMLSSQIGDSVNSPFEYLTPLNINSALTAEIDVSQAKVLEVNKASGACYQGQTHGHKGFLIETFEAESILKMNPKNKEVLFPYLTGDDLLGNINSLPSRYVIDFGNREIFEASSYPDLYKRTTLTVYPDKKKKALDEAIRNEKALDDNPKAKVGKDHSAAFKNWWQLFRSRREMLQTIAPISRYVCCSRVSKRPIFEFVSSSIHPNDALQVFPLEDDYSFGILQSKVHCVWFNARCSSLKGDTRYTSDTVFDSFPWPQKPTENDIAQIAKFAFELRVKRRELMCIYSYSLRSLYKLMETSSNNEISRIQENLDRAVHSAYGIKKKDDILTFLFKLNQECHEKEFSHIDIQGPGLPINLKNKKSYVTDDCVSICEK